MTDNASEIKRYISVYNLAERYGYTPNRAGFIRCPFHSDGTASLKIYQNGKGWYCFGCKRGGSVIDFAMQHDDIGFGDACRKLDDMFNLGLYRELSFAEMRKKKHEQTIQERGREQEKAEKQHDEYCRNVLTKYFYWLWSNDERTVEMENDLAYLQRILDSNELLKFDPVARVRSLASKHLNGGDIDGIIGGN